MSSDINIILQLLQRQLSQVPPAYSPISPSSHNLAMYGILPRSLEPLTPCAPLEDQETTTPEQVRPPFLAQHQLSFLLPQADGSWRAGGSLQPPCKQSTTKRSWVQAEPRGLETGVDLPRDASAHCIADFGAQPANSSTTRLPHQ